IPPGPVPAGSVLAGLLLATAAVVLRRTRSPRNASAGLELRPATGLLGPAVVRTATAVVRDTAVVRAAAAAVVRIAAVVSGPAADAARPRAAVPPTRSDAAPIPALSPERGPLRIGLVR